VTGSEWVQNLHVALAQDQMQMTCKRKMTRDRSVLVRWHSKYFHAPRRHAMGSDNGAEFLPTLLNHLGVWQLWVLVGLYFLILVAALVGLIVGLRSQGSAFRSSFLFVAVIMLSNRLFFLVVEEPGWENHPFWLYLVIYFLPFFLQYWMFSLLILFVVRCRYLLHDQVNRIKRCLYPAFHASQFGLLAVCVVFSYVLAAKWITHEQKHPDDVENFQAHWDQQPALVTAVMYGLLAIVGAYYSVKVYDMVEDTRQLVLTPMNKMRTTRLANFLIMLPIFLVIFVLRAAWNILYFYDINPLQNYISGCITSDDFPAFATAYLLFYSVMEIIPISIVVVVFISSFRSEDTSAQYDYFAAPSTQPIISPLSSPRRSPRAVIVGDRRGSPASMYRASRDSSGGSGERTNASQRSSRITDNRDIFDKRSYQRVGSPDTPTSRSGLHGSIEISRSPMGSPDASVLEAISYSPDRQYLYETTLLEEDSQSHSSLHR
jgi:hypothetical protein